MLTLNEEEGIKHVMPRVKKEWVDQILISDGGSKDHTVQAAKSMGFETILQSRPGLRHGYNEALPHIKGDIVVTFSPDGNSIPELIPKLTKKIEEGYDIAVASRYKDGAKSDDDDAMTGFGNWMFTRLINLVHGSKYTDALVIFRAWKKNVYTDLDLHLDESFATEEKLFRTRMGIEPLMAIRAAKRKLKVAEIPGDEPARITGQRKLQVFRWGSGFLWEIFREIFYWR